MTGRLRRHRLAAVVSLAALWLTTLASGSAAAATARVAESFTRDVYFVGSYEHQVDSRTCTAAATAMMENMIARRDLGLDQMTILRYEQPRDALNDATQRGSDPLGWSRAATYFSSRTPYLTTYKWEAYTTESAALRRVATQLAKTGKPGGLLVLHGTHAMVMTGFIATADPRKGPFALSYVYVSDPNGYAHYRYTAAGSPLDTYLETDASRTYDLAWYGKYVVIVPQDG